jgi:hypothetical protein
MTVHLSGEEKAIIKFIEKIPFAETPKKQFLKEIETEGLDDELAEKIRAKLAKLPRAEGEDEFTRGYQLAELSNLVRQWRMKKNAKKFHDRR